MLPELLNEMQTVPQEGARREKRERGKKRKQKTQHIRHSGQSSCPVHALPWIILTPTERTVGLACPCPLGQNCLDQGWALNSG